MINYKNIIDYIDREIPEFAESGEDQSLREYKSIYLNYLAAFHVRNVYNSKLTDKLATLINKMSDSDDPDVQIILDDFILTLYDEYVEKGEDIGVLHERLSRKAKDIYNENIEKWKNGGDYQSDE